MALIRPPAQYVEKFLLQSYFDSTLLQAAILNSPSNSVIIPSTEKRVDTKGVGVGLDPASETPIAVEFLSPDGGTSGALVIKPGQTVRPGFEFSGVRWGLPKGWLGGGLAVLNVIRSEGSDVRYTGVPRPVIFHRTRLILEAEAGGPALPALRRNWPSRFPWTRATRGATAIVQASGPVLSVRPEKVLARLRNAADPTNEQVVRFHFRSSFDFDMDALGVLGVTDVDSTWVDVTFPAVTPSTLVTYPTVEVPVEFARLACDEGGVTVVPFTPGLVGSYLDVVRYGSLG